MQIVVSESLPGVVCVHTEETRRGRTIERSLYVGRATASWLYHLLGEPDPEDPRFYIRRDDARLGGDVVSLRTGGHEQAPILSIGNDRAEGLEHGVYGSVATPLARLGEVMRQLRGLVT